jgi:hypothetical protein
MKLKIRSPIKSSPQSLMKNAKQRNIAMNDLSQRKSPRIKDKIISKLSKFENALETRFMFLYFLKNIDDALAENRKRPRTCLVTDTPDHKQNSTIIAIKQEKVRKRFFTQILSNSKILPTIPDTPEKVRPDINQIPDDAISIRKIQFFDKNLCS